MPNDMIPSEAAGILRDYAEVFKPLKLSQALEMGARAIDKYSIIHSAAQHAAYDLAPNLHGDRNVEAARQILAEALKACEL